MMTTNQVKLDQLPDTILVEILSNLDPKSFVNSSLASKRIRNLCFNSSGRFHATLWKGLCQRYFPNANVQENYKYNFQNLYAEGLAIRDGTRGLKYFFEYELKLKRFLRWLAANGDTENPNQLAEFSLQRIESPAIFDILRNSAGLEFENLPAALRANQSIVFEAIKMNYLMFQYAARPLKADRDFVLRVVQQQGLTLQFLSQHFKADREIARAAVSQYGLALQYVAESLKSDREIVQIAIAQDGEFIQYAAMERKADTELVLMAIKGGGNVLKWIAAPLQADKDIVLAAVKQQGIALRYAAEALKDDKDVVIAAVKKNGLTLEYATNRLKADREVVQIAVAQNRRARRFAAEALQGLDFVGLAQSKPVAHRSSTLGGRK